jgi:hypothetical protein
MNAALRVWWTFFTAFALQRRFAQIGVVLCALLVAAGLIVRDPIWIIGPIFVLVLTAFPALFASAAVFRALSAQRMQRLFPYSRPRMLAAVALLVATLLLFCAPLFLAPAALAGRPLPLEPFAYAFTVITALFLVGFLQCGDWRWTYVWVAVILALSTLRPASVSREALAAVPAWAWLVGALTAWTAFAAWYLRAPRIRPLAFAQARGTSWSRTSLDAPLARDAAVRALAALQLPGSRSGYVGNAFLIAGGGLLASAGPFSFTTFVWPFMTMIMLGAKAAAFVQRSRLLWLRTPGPRDAVRREIERLMWRSATTGLWVLLVVAAVYASPLGGARPGEVLAGFALAAGAGIYGQSVALANVHSRVFYLFGFGLMVPLHLALLTPPTPSATAVATVIAAELVGIVVLRALAVLRWRHIDWVRLRQVTPPGSARIS